MKSKNFILTLFAFAIAGSLAFAIFLFKSEIKKDKLPVLGKVHEFQLTDQNNQTFTSRQLMGKVWIADFIFTTCADICPMMSANMAKLNRTFEQLHQVKLISISVNPEYDSPNRLQEYAKQYDSDGKKWIFLTGEREDIRKIVVDNFKLGSIEEPIFHSSYFTLVDQHGLIRGYYDGKVKEDLNKIFKDAATLINEKTLFHKQ